MILESKQCQCNMCAHIFPLIRKIEVRLPDDIRQQFTELVNSLLMKLEDVSNDLCHLRACQKGDWPGLCGYRFGDTFCEIVGQHEGPHRNGGFVWTDATHIGKESFTVEDLIQHLEITTLSRKVCPTK